jgi:predicted RNA-binding protein with PUA-like domain
MARRYWLMKTEPGTFSIDDLARRPGGRAFWDGVRNYQARNLLRDEVRAGDAVLLYHSGIPHPAVVGTATVVGAAAPDPTQFDRRSPYHDPGADPVAPRWYGVEIALERVFTHPVTLATLRTTPGLEGMVLLRRGNRLSVTPVRPEEWSIIVARGA